jgi:hypothetical protein
VYPERQLADLAVRKAIVQARIAVRREECVRAASALAAGPVALADRALGLWRSIPQGVKAVGIPLAILAAAVIVRRTGKARLTALLRVAPVILQTVRVAAERRAAAGTAGRAATAPPAQRSGRVRVAATSSPPAAVARSGSAAAG